MSSKGFSITFNSPVILWFAIISGLALLASYLTLGYSNQLLFITHSISLFNPLSLIRMFTHVLGHANLDHYINNMLLFILVGPMLEEKYGSYRILIVIALTAVVTAIINSVFSNMGLLGASGVVFAFIILASMTSFKEGEIPLTFIIVLILYLGREVYNGLFAIDNISQMAHLIGGICGAITGFAFSRRN